MYGIYRATVGGWLSGLAQAATGNLLAVPSLDPYQISYQRPDGSAVYVLNTELVRFDVAVNFVANLAAGKPNGSITTGLTGNQAVCTTAAFAGATERPQQCHVGGWQRLPGRRLFPANGTYALFNIVRGFSLLLVILLMGRYFLALMSGGAEKRKFGITAFFARCVFAFALILGMDVVLRVMAGVVAETVLVTNLLGTQAGGGTPYSHLWLFSAYPQLSLARSEHLCHDHHGPLLAAWPVHLAGLQLVALRDDLLRGGRESAVGHQPVELSAPGFLLPFFALDVPTVSGPVALLLVVILILFIVVRYARHQRQRCRIGQGWWA